MFFRRKSAIFILIILSLSFSCKTVSRLFNNSGTQITVQVETDEQDKTKLVQQAVNMIESKLNSASLDGEVLKVADNPDQISVKLYGTNDLEKIKKYLFTTYKLELKRLISPPSPSLLQTYSTQEAALANTKTNQEVLPFKESGEVSPQKFVIVEKESIVTGADVRSASSMKRENLYTIIFSLNKQGAEKLGRWTGQNINNYMAIVVNKEVVSAAFIKSQIFDSGQIDGRFTKEAAEDIAMSLNSGYFPATLKIVEEKPFGNASK